MAIFGFVIGLCIFGFDFLEQVWVNIYDKGVVYIFQFDYEVFFVFLVEENVFYFGKVFIQDFYFVIVVEV